MLKNKTHRTSCACYSKSLRYSLINVILIVNLIIDLEKKTKDGLFSVINLQLD